MYWTERMKNHIDAAIKNPRRKLKIPPSEPLFRELMNPNGQRRVDAVFQVLIEQGKEREQALKASRQLADAIGKIVEKTPKKFGGEKLWDQVDEALGSYERINAVIEDSDTETP